jgi:cytochrome c551/c552
MIQAMFTVPLAAALAAVAVSAKAQDIAAGHAFAREACNACHVVEFEQRGFVIGPAFRDLANTKGNDGNSTTSLPYELTSKNAEPDSYAGRKSERRCVHSRLVRSALTTPPRPSTVAGHAKAPSEVPDGQRGCQA